MRQRTLIVGISLSVLLGLVFLSFLWLGRSGTADGPVPRPELTARLTQALRHGAPTWQVAFSPRGDLLASAAVDGNVRLWRLPAGEPAGTLTQPAGITCLAFSPDGTRLATGSYDQVVRIWRLADGAVERALSGSGGTVWSVDFSPDGQRLVSGGEDRTVRVWRLADGSSQAIGGHALNVWSVAFSPDGRWIASGSFDRTVKLWRADTGALARTLSGHGQAVVDLAFSPDGQLLATGSDDASVMLWNVSDGSVVDTLTEGSEHVYAVAFSPNGRWLASGSREMGAMGTLLRQIAGDRPGMKRHPTVRLWKVADGSLQQALAEHVGDVHSVAFSGDGAWLASAGEDGLVRLWRLAEVE